MIFDLVYINIQKMVGKFYIIKGFEITAKHSTERYTWGGTHNKTSRDKTAHVTMKLIYDIQ